MTGPISEVAYARRLGITTRQLRRVGMEKLKALSPEARNLLLFATKVGHQCSLATDPRREEFQQLKQGLAERFVVIPQQENGSIAAELK